jgi:hypothetical protein
LLAFEAMFSIRVIALSLGMKEPPLPEPLPATEE